MVIVCVLHCVVKATRIFSVGGAWMKWYSSGAGVSCHRLRPPPAPPRLFKPCVHDTLVQMMRCGSVLGF